MYTGTTEGTTIIYKMADSGKLMKMEVDHSDTVDKSLPEYQEMARVRS